MNFHPDDFLPYDPEREKKEKEKPAWEKLRYKLYSPSSFSKTNTDGYGKFNEEDYQGNFASIEFATRLGSVKSWYQVVDKYSNKVVAEKKKDDLDF